MYKIIFYWNERGDEPVRDFLLTLPIKNRKKIAVWIDLLKQEGPHLRRPYADKVKDKLYELRIRQSSDQIRILYFFLLGHKLIMLHGFRMKSSAIDFSDIQLAEQRRLDFLQRIQSRKISL